MISSSDLLFAGLVAVALIVTNLVGLAVVTAVRALRMRRPEPRGSVSSGPEPERPA